MILYQSCQMTAPQYGALAQLGERYTGSVEVSGSIPLCSTKANKSEPIAKWHKVRIYCYTGRYDLFICGTFRKLVMA